MPSKWQDAVTYNIRGQKKSTLRHHGKYQKYRPVNFINKMYCDTRSARDANGFFSLSLRLTTEMENKYIEIEGFASAKATGFGFSRLRFDAPSIVVLLWSSLVLPSTRPTHTSIATTNDADLVHGNIMHQWWPIPSNSTTLWRCCCCANTQTAAAADSYIQCGPVGYDASARVPLNLIESVRDLLSTPAQGLFFHMIYSSRIYNDVNNKRDKESI